jgi:hypothetical protein
MTVEEAFDTALQYEKAIRDQYIEAASGSIIPEARALYETLAKDEGYHVAYLEQQRAAWKRTGKTDGAEPRRALPPGSEVSAAIARARSSFSAIPEGGQMGALQNALHAEEATSAFYRSLAGQFPPDIATVFTRLLEIEDGHTAIVRSELDLVSGTGHWFDVRVFDMEE